MRKDYQLITTSPNHSSNKDFPMNSTTPLSICFSWKDGLISLVPHAGIHSGWTISYSSENELFTGNVYNLETIRWLSDIILELSTTSECTRPLLRQRLCENLSLLAHSKIDFGGKNSP